MFPAMHGPDPGSISPQFETVEYQASPGNCALCNQPIGSTYYRVNGAQACSICVQREQNAQRESNAHYSRALMFGIGAAILGVIGYAAFEIATGWIIGYVSLGVGWLVGKAMLKGSNGIGGRRYQITAALLTYAAVSLAAIPVWISVIQKQKQSHPPVEQREMVSPSEQQPSSSSPDSSSAANPDISQANPPAAETPKTKKPKMEVGKAMGLLLLIGLASPFLELSSPISGFIGLFILFIGMQIAWRMTGRPKLIINGPF